MATAAVKAAVRKRLDEARGIIADAKGAVDRVELPEKKIQFAKEDFAALKIKNKKNKKLSFSLNPLQEEMLRGLNEQFMTRGYVREVLLKARKFGGSTYYVAVAWMLMRDYGWKGVIMGHVKGASDNLYAMLKLFNDSDPKSPRGRRLAYNSRNLHLPNGGECVVSSAESPDAITSQTNQFLILTEVALWPNVESQMASLLPTVADEFGLVIMESTARGPGNYFHNEYLDAKKGGATRPYFFGWQDVPWDYSRPLDTEEERAELMESLDQDEQILYDAGVSPEQLNWRRAKLYSIQGNIDIFNREYPSNDIEAFVNSGRPVFPPMIINQMIEKAKDPISRREVRIHTNANIQDIAAGDEAALDMAFEKVNNGRLEIFEYPQPHANYEAGCDVAEGVVTPGKRRGDESTIYVNRRDTGMTAAVWCGRVPPEDFASVIAYVCTMYNEAFTVIEDNNHGHTTLSYFEKMYPAHKIYRRKLTDEKDVKVLGGAPAPTKAGFNTNGSTKPIALNAAAYLVRKEQVTILHRDTLKELATLMWEESGGGKCETKGKDRSIAFVLAMVAHENGADFNRDPIVKTPLQMLEDWRREVRARIKMQSMCMRAG